MVVRAMSMNAEVIESVKVCVRTLAAYSVLIIRFLTNYCHPNIYFRLKLAQVPFMFSVRATARSVSELRVLLKNLESTSLLRS